MRVWVWCKQEWSQRSSIRYSSHSSLTARYEPIKYWQPGVSLLSTAWYVYTPNSKDRKWERTTQSEKVNTCYKAVVEQQLLVTLLAIAHMDLTACFVLVMRHQREGVAVWVQFQSWSGCWVVIKHVSNQYQHGMASICTQTYIEHHTVRAKLPCTMRTDMPMRKLYVVSIMRQVGIGDKLASETSWHQRQVSIRDKLASETSWHQRQVSIRDKLASETS